MEKLEKKIRQEGISPIAELIEKLELISIDPIKPECIAKVGSQLPEREKRKLTNFLRKHADMFIWSYEDMLGIGQSM